MQFTKAHGCGNDFIILEVDREGEERRSLLIELQRCAIILCDRHRGVGADGILVIFTLPSNSSAEMPKYEMKVINADGSLAEMCGNGLRCVGAYLYKRGKLRGGQRLLTGSGALTLSFDERAPLFTGGAQSPEVKGEVSWVGVRLPPPLQVVQRHVKVDAYDEPIPMMSLSLGNPHAVIINHPCFEQRRGLAPLLQKEFAGGVNVSFAREVGVKHLELFVFERGCGWTQACGTGACATTIAAVEMGLIPRDEELRVSLPGGTLLISQLSTGDLQMWGPAVEVFDGVLPVSF